MPTQGRRRLQATERPKQVVLCAVPSIWQIRCLLCVYARRDQLQYHKIEEYVGCLVLTTPQSRGRSAVN